MRLRQIREFDDFRDQHPLPSAAVRWTSTVQRESEALRDRGMVPGSVVCSRPDRFWNGLRTILDAHWLRGVRLLEWGSGLGTIAGLAALRGLHAHGIELGDGLAEIAGALAARHTLPVRFAAGSFVPDGISDRFEVRATLGATRWDATPDQDAYRQLDLASGEADLVFAYPWAREHAAFEALFQTVAGPGALLWLYVEDGPSRLLRAEPEASDSLRA